MKADNRLKKEAAAKLGDLKAVVLMDEGLTMTGASAILDQTVTNVRERLLRLERATGKRIYTRHSGKPPLRPARLTKDGKVLAEKAREILQIWEDVA